MLASKGFTTSFSAQPISPFAPLPHNYPKCWHELLEWSGHITPRTIPYRVNQHSILPPPHGNGDYLELVEVPLNMWVDNFELYVDKDNVSRLDMFDCHYNWARDNGYETAVAIGVHADVVARETWGSGEISQLIDSFLNHVQQRALEGGTEVAYATASEVAERFWDNKTIGHVVCGPGLYAAIWEQRDGPPWQARHGITAAQYQQAFDELVAQGYRLIHLSGYTVRRQELYAAVWEQRDGPPWQARHGLTAAQYQQTFDELVAQGYHLVCVSGYGSDGQDLYAAVWEQRGAPPWQARHGLTAAQHQQSFDELSAQGYRLVHVSGYTSGGEDRYAAIWEQRGGPPWQARHGLTAEQYQQTFDELNSQGYRLIQVCGYGSDGTDRFAAIWEQRSSPAWQARHGLTDAQYQQTFNELVIAPGEARRILLGESPGRVRVSHPPVSSLASVAESREGRTKQAKRRQSIL